MNKRLKNVLVQSIRKKRRMKYVVIRKKVALKNIMSARLEEQIWGSKY